MPDFPPPPTPIINIPSLPEEIRRLREEIIDLEDERSFSVTDLPAGQLKHKLIYTKELGNPVLSLKGDGTNYASIWTHLQNLQGELKTSLFQMQDQVNVCVFKREGVIDEVISGSLETDPDFISNPLYLIGGTTYYAWDGMLGSVPYAGREDVLDTDTLYLHVWLTCRNMTGGAASATVNCRNVKGVIIAGHFQ